MSLSSNSYSHLKGFIIILQKLKENMMKKILLALLCSFGITAVYADNCDTTRNTYDDIYCTNKIYASADADLNKNYQALRAN